MYTDIICTTPIDKLSPSIWTRSYSSSPHPKINGARRSWGGGPTTKGGWGESQHRNEDLNLPCSNLSMYVYFVPLNMVDLSISVSNYQRVVFRWIQLDWYHLIQLDLYDLIWFEQWNMQGLWWIYLEKGTETNHSMGLEQEKMTRKVPSSNST